MIDNVIPTPQLWHEHAACRDSGLDFYNLELENAHRCIAYCRECPVQDECLEASIYPRFEATGIWGGLRPDARQKIRRREQRLALKARKAQG